MRVLTIFSLLLLGLTINFTISSPSLAQSRSDYLGAYRDWMLPTTNVGPKSLAQPQSDYFGAYRDWILPTRNVGRKPAPAQTKPLTADVKPRTDYDHGNSGSFYDFYLDWMLPRVKPKTPRTIPFLTRLITRQRSDVHSQVYSLDNHK